MIKQMNEQEIYQNYVADTLRFIVNNTAEQESRTMINISLRELLHPVTKEDVESNEKKASDIIANMKNKLQGG